MRYPIEIEDIEGMRRLAGIDDVELRSEIRSLRLGDMVKLTFWAGPSSECLFVRITRIRGFKSHLPPEACVALIGAFSISSSSRPRIARFSCSRSTSFRFLIGLVLRVGSANEVAEDLEVGIRAFWRPPDAWQEDSA